MKWNLYNLENLPYALRRVRLFAMCNVLTQPIVEYLYPNLSETHDELLKNVGIMPTYKALEQLIQNKVADTNFKIDIAEGDHQPYDINIVAENQYQDIYSIMDKYKQAGKSYQIIGDTITSKTWKWQTYIKQQSYKKLVYVCADCGANRYYTNLVLRTKPGYFDGESVAITTKIKVTLNFTAYQDGHGYSNSVDVNFVNGEANNITGLITSSDLDKIVGMTVSESNNPIYRYGTVLIQNGLADVVNSGLSETYYTGAELATELLTILTKTQTITGESTSKETLYKITDSFDETPAISETNLSFLTESGFKTRVTNFAKFVAEKESLNININDAYKV